MIRHSGGSSARTTPALEELRAHPHWVCWRKEKRDHKVTKVPYNPRTGQWARSNDPKTWASYERAQGAYERSLTTRQPYDGIGYMFHADITGIDLDHCITGDGTIDPWAQAYLDRLASYSEISPSGEGIHILVRGTVPDHKGRRRPIPKALHPHHPEAAVEMYDRGRFFTVTGWHVEGTPVSIEDRSDVLMAVYAEIAAPHQKQTTPQGPRDHPAEDLSDDALLDKAIRARNGATFRALWGGDTSGYVSQSEAELALCHLLAFWTGKDAQRIDRLFRRSALYRPDKWERAARSGETYGQGTIARAIASCSETYAPQRKGKVIQFRGRPTKLDDPAAAKFVQLPETELDFVLDCLRDEEEGDARLYAHLFRGKCIYDHTEKMWYEWRGHYWERDECKHSLLLASGPLASAYLEASAHLAEAAAQGEKKLDPDLLKGKETDPEQEHYQWLKAMTGMLIGRARALKKLQRAQAVLTYAQAYLSITSKEWDHNPWLLGTRDGVIDLKAGTLRKGSPEEYIRTIIPTTWKGLDEPAPRFERYLREIFADRRDSERETLIAFLQRALGYGITGNVSEHIFLMLYGEEGRNGKDTLMTVLQRALGSSVGAVSNDVIIASGKYTTPGSAKPHLCALQGKRIAWASETDKGARFDVGQVKFLTGGGTIPARQLYGHDYTFDPSHLLILLTNNKPHADAKDAAFWDRLCPIIFTLRFVDHPRLTNERQKDRTLVQALEQEASGILAWLVRGCLAWQREGLTIPPSVLQARREYREEEDTLGLFIKEYCVVAEQLKVQGKQLYERYKDWTQENNLKAMSGNAFGIELKKLFPSKREEKGWFYFGIGLLEEALYTSSAGIHSHEAPSEGHSSPSMDEIPVYPVYLSQKIPLMREQKSQRESFQERYTGYTGAHPHKTPLSPPVEAVEIPSERGTAGIQETQSRHYVETVDGLGYLSGNRREQDVSFLAEERKAALRYKIGVVILRDGVERFYYPGMVFDARPEGIPVDG